MGLILKMKNENENENDMKNNKTDEAETNKNDASNDGDTKNNKKTGSLKKGRKVGMCVVCKGKESNSKAMVKCQICEKTTHTLCLIPQKN